LRDLSGGAPSLLSINGATVRKQADLLGIIDACARHGIAAISPWRDQVDAVGLERAFKAIRHAGLKLSGFCRGGLFPSDAAHRNEMRDDNRRYVDAAAALCAPCLIVVAGGLPQYARPGSAPSKDIVGARAQIEDGLAELLAYARTVKLPLAALEPLHPMYCADRAAVNTLAQALDIAQRLDPQQSGAADLALGVAVDVYHTWWDSDLYASIARAGRDKRILAYHICDWLVPTKDMLNDCGMMGDGVIELPRIRAAVEAAGYSGLIEAEIFFDHWWAQPIDTVLSICVERYRTVVCTCPRARATRDASPGREARRPPAQRTPTGRDRSCSRDGRRRAGRRRSSRQRSPATHSSQKRFLMPTEASNARADRAMQPSSARP
jgi:sugar phosphate isomerase/epimerase